MTSPFSLHCRQRFAPSPALQKGGREPLGGAPRSFGKPHPGFAACGRSTVPDKLTRILSLIVAQPHPALQALPPSLSAVCPENFLQEAGGKTTAANILSTWQKDMVEITDTPPFRPGGSPAWKIAEEPDKRLRGSRFMRWTAGSQRSGFPPPLLVFSICRPDFLGTGGAGPAYPDNKPAQRGPWDGGHCIFRAAVFLPAGSCRPICQNA